MDADLDNVTAEFLSFERRLTEVLHELNMKQKSLAECRQSLENVLLKQQDLECMLDAERQKTEKMQMHLEVALNAVQSCGEEKAAAVPELSRLRIELGVTIRERDRFKEQISTVQMENMTLTREVEELKSQLHCQQLFQDTNRNLEARVQATIEEVKSELQKLDEDHKRLELTVDAAEKVGNNLQKSHRHIRLMLEKAIKQKKNDEAEIIALRAEADNLRRKIIEPANPVQHKCNESKSLKYLEELKEFMTAESKGSEELEEALKKALDAQATCQKLEQDVADKLQKQTVQLSILQQSNDDLNRNLSDANNKLSILQQSKDDLNRSLCGTNNKLSILQQLNDDLNRSLHDANKKIRSLEEREQELLKRPESADQNIQTEILQYMYKDHETQTSTEEITPESNEYVNKNSTTMTICSQQSFTSKETETVPPENKIDGCECVSCTSVPKNEDFKEEVTKMEFELNPEAMEI
ncbi:putative leucine-rich repeat-containing protein DDB_G0290503 [Periplaneta americana]|uniref:putative leucine-rich repeat-containing protein DDB_G0290503 n=1 Tax=Periplaneta americana TaxID=6978 RepID=UPI0037E921A4